MRSLWVAGLGAVGPEPGAGRAPRRVARGPHLQEGFPPGAVRWLDDASLWWTGAARSALGGEPAPDAGQVVGLGWTPLTPVQQNLSAALQQGYAAMPPALFPFTVGNASAGQAGLLLGLRGGAVTLNAKEGAGLAAAVEAFRLLRAGRMDHAVAGGVDVLDPFLLRLLGRVRPARSAPLGEGAWALSVRAAADPPPGALCRVAAWAQWGTAVRPHAFPEAGAPLGRLDRLLRERCGWGAREADLLDLPDDTPALESGARRWAEGEASRGRPTGFRSGAGVCGASWAGTLGAAARALAEGRGRRAAVFALATGGACYAVALEAAGG